MNTNENWWSYKLCLLNKTHERLFGVPPLGGLVGKLPPFSRRPAKAGTPNSIHPSSKNHAQVLRNPDMTEPVYALAFLSETKLRRSPKSFGARPGFQISEQLCFVPNSVKYLRGCSQLYSGRVHGGIALFKGRELQITSLAKHHDWRFANIRMGPTRYATKKSRR